MKHRRYKLISEFDTNGKHLYVVMVNGNVHVMDQSELDKLVYKDKRYNYGDKRL